MGHGGHLTHYSSSLFKRFLLTQDQQGEVSVMMSLTRFKDWAAAWTASIASHHAWTKSSLLPRDWQWSGDFSPRKFSHPINTQGEKNLLAFSANCFPTGTDMLGRSRFRLVWSRSAGIRVVCSLPRLERTDVFARRILFSFRSKTDTNVCTIE